MKIIAIYILLIVGMGCTQPLTSEKLSGNINASFSIKSGKGLTETHTYNVKKGTHTIVYKATGKDSFWFNDYALFNMHNALVNPRTYGHARKNKTFSPSTYLFYDEFIYFAHGTYRKLVLSIDGKDTLLDSIPNLSKRNWISPSSRKTRIVDYRKRSRRFPTHDIPKRIREKYNFSNGLIKETYVDSSYKYELILNAKSKDTLYFTSRRYENINKKNSQVTKKYYDAFSIFISGFLNENKLKRFFLPHFLPPITQKTLYNNGELVSDKVYLTIKGKDYIIYTHQFLEGKEVYTTLNRMRIKYPHDTIYPIYNFNSDTIWKYDFRKYNSNEVAPVVSAILDTTSEYYLGEKVLFKLKDSSWYDKKYVEFGTFSIKLPYWSENKLFQYRYYADYLPLESGIAGIHKGYVHYKNGDRPYGTRLILPYPLMDEAKDSSKVYPIVFIKKKNRETFIINSFVGGGIVTKEYHSDDSVCLEIFARHNWPDRNLIPKVIPKNAKKSYFYMTKSMLRTITTFGSNNNQVYWFKSRNLHRKDLLAYDSFSYANGKTGATKRSLIERPNYFENIATSRMGKSYSVNIKQIERYNRYIVNIFKDRKKDFSFILTRNKTDEQSITEKLYSYIPLNYPIGRHNISHTWKGHQSNILNSSFVGTNVKPGTYIVMDLMDSVLLQSNKQITEKWIGDTLFISEKNKDSEYKIMILRGLIHSIDYIKNKKIYHLVYWEKNGDELLLKNTYEDYPQNIKKMLANNIFYFSSVESEDYKCQSLQKYSLMHYLKPGLKNK